MKRFYETVAVGRDDGMFAVLLDGKPVRTPLGAAQRAPTAALAEALAAEWRDQGETIDPHKFRFRDLTDYAIDIVENDRDGQIAKLLAFLETDTLCYRADPDDALFRRQNTVWKPILDAFEARYDVRLTHISGIMHRPQPARSIARIGEELNALDPFELAGLFTLTSLASSLVIGMRALAPDADRASLWHAANLEEDWQNEHWGTDAEAATVRERRTDEFGHAFRFIRLLKD